MGNLRIFQQTFQWIKSAMCCIPCRLLVEQKCLCSSSCWCSFSLCSSLGSLVDPALQQFWGSSSTEWVGCLQEQCKCSVSVWQSKCLKVSGYLVKYWLKWDQCTEVIQGVENLPYEDRLSAGTVELGEEKVMGRAASSLSVSKGRL